MRWAILLMFVGCSRPEPAPQRPVYRDFRGIIHCHSLYSHDSKGKYEEILAAAKKARVDFIIMTDHPPKDDPGRPLREGWRGVRDGVLFIQGEELGSQVLALGITEPVLARGRQEMIDAIHAQGGLAFIAHPEEVKTWDFERFDGMEIYNVHAALKRKQKEKDFLFAAMAKLKEDPENVFMMLLETDPAILARWDELNKSRRVVGIAGNDSHQNVNIMGVQVDPYERAFKFVSTHVLAEELTERSILDALKSGRCYVAFDILGDPRDDPLQTVIVGGGALRYERTRELNGRSYPWLIANPGLR